jgi:site-specific recombinase XerD
MALMSNSTANHELEKVEKKIDDEVKKKDKSSAFKKHLSMHVGRHTFATLALSAGVRIETVSRMLAHADITTTQIYAKVLQKDVDEGFDILEKI